MHTTIFFLCVSNFFHGHGLPLLSLPWPLLLALCSSQNNTGQQFSLFSCRLFTSPQSTVPSGPESCNCCEPSGRGPLPLLLALCFSQNNTGKQFIRCTHNHSCAYQQVCPESCTYPAPFVTPACPCSLPKLTRPPHAIDDPFRTRKHKCYCTYWVTTRACVIG